MRRGHLRGVGQPRHEDRQPGQHLQAARHALRPLDELHQGGRLDQVRGPLGRRELYPEERRCVVRRQQPERHDGRGNTRSPQPLRQFLAASHHHGPPLLRQRPEHRRGQPARIVDQHDVRPPAARHRRRLEQRRHPARSQHPFRHGVQQQRLAAPWGADHRNQAGLAEAALNLGQRSPPSRVRHSLVWARRSREQRMTCAIRHLGGIGCRQGRDGGQGHSPNVSELLTKLFPTKSIGTTISVELVRIGTVFSLESVRYRIGCVSAPGAGPGVDGAAAAGRRSRPRHEARPMLLSGDRATPHGRPVRPVGLPARLPLGLQPILGAWTAPAPFQLWKQRHAPAARRIRSLAQNEASPRTRGDRTWHEDAACSLLRAWTAARTRPG